MPDLVSELDLPEFDMTDADLSGDAYHERLAAAGDRHRRLRALVAPAFTPRSAARWRPVMREIAGAPQQDAAALHEWSSLVQRQFDIRPLAAGPERLGGVEGSYGIESLPLAWSAA